MNAGELRDYYGLLGVLPAATVSDIHKAYWHKACRSHPDRGGSHEAMVQLVEAWKILSDPVKRSRYDQLRTFRHNGWKSNKFNSDVQDARSRAAGCSSRTWAEFEAIYQKAFYTFNQDFYGEDIKGKTAGPYSPLMSSDSSGKQGNGEEKNKTSMRTLDMKGGTLFAYLMKTLLLLAAVLALFLFYRKYSGNGRFVPLGQPDASIQMILDTSTGAVYSADKKDGVLTSPWKETVAPFPRDKK